ncbi:MAG: PAS domain S-box protein [Lacunisphaera sp.]|nr:PAS domain S-box protein [Lacunisphaera sp.]
MKNSIQRPVVLARLAALTAASAGAFSLVTWSAGEWRLAALGANYVPMAPLTALLFVLLGLAFSARLQWPDSRLAHRVCSASAVLTGIVGGLVPVQLRWEFGLPWDHWFVGVTATVGTIPVGRMSPLTALVFLLTAAALFGQSPRGAAHPAIRRCVYLLAGAGLAVCCIVAVAYVIGTPLLYDGSTVPMALLTALAFMALNAGVLLAGQVDKLLQEWREFDISPDSSAETRGFARQLIFSLLVIGGLITLVGLLYLRREQAAARQAVHQSLEAIANLKADQIRTWRNERLGEARFLQHTPAVLRDVVAFAAAPADPAARARVQGWLEPLKGGDRYAAILVLDAQARPLLAIPAAAAARVSPELFAQALASPGPILGDLQRNPGDPAVHLDLLVPVRPPASGDPAIGVAPIGVIVLRLDPAQFLYPLIQNWPVPSDSAESLLVRREGEEVVYLSELRHRRGASLILRRSIHELDLPAAMAARGETGAKEGTDYRGIAVLAVAHPLSDSPWIVVTKVDTAEAYAPIQRDAWQTGLVVILLLVAVVLAGLTLWRQRHTSYLRVALAEERKRKTVTDRLNLVMQHANDIILIFDENMRIIEANEQALVVYGRSAAEMRRLTVEDLRPREGRAGVKAEFARVLASSGTKFETVHQRSDGSLFLVEVSTRSFETEGRRKVLSIVRDITERKAQEREIDRLNRMYLVISQVSQAIVRSPDRTQLLQDLCRVLVEFGHFKIAWVGWLDPTTQLLDPVAVSGDEHGYVPGLRVSANAGLPEGQGPIGRSFRSGQTVLVNDFLGEAATKPWHECARRSGLKSVLTLPLRQEGKLPAVLAVYSAEVNFFGPKEVALLEEAAGDVSFSLDVMDVTERREAEAALRESEGKFRLLFERTADAFLLIDVNSGLFIDCNQAALAMLRCTDRREVVMRHPEELSPSHQPDGRPSKEKADEIIAAAMRTGSQRFEWTHCSAQRPNFPVEVLLTPILLGERQLIMTTWRDLTERKQAEAQLQKLSRVVEQSPTSIVITDLTGTIEYVNPWFCSLTGYTPDEVRGQNPRMFKSGDTPPETYADMWRTLAAGRTWRGELHNRKKNGEPHTELCVIAPVLGPNGQANHYVAIKDDITERLRLETVAREVLQSFNNELELKVTQRTAELSARNRQIEALLKAIPDSVMRLRIDGTVLHAQPAQISPLLAAITPREGTKPNDAPAAALIASSLELGRRALFEATTVVSEAEIITPTGPLVVELRTAPTETDEFVVFTRDITARKRLEVETAALLEREHQVSEMKTRFISMTSHEFRTPMTAIMGSVELLANHLDQLTPEKRTQIFDRITLSLHRLTAMLNDVLMLSRMDARRTEVRLVALNLGPFVQNIVEEIRSGDHGAHPLVVHLPDAAVSLVTDPNLLHHILSNLLGNAVRYSPAGAAVTVRVECDAWRLRLSVEDHGIGIPPADRARIFESFERGSNVGNIQGTGLGLNIVKRMTDLLGGHITLRSVVGGGTRFTLALPLRPNTTIP